MGSQTFGHTIERLSHFACPSLPPHCSSWSLGSPDPLHLLAHPCLCPLRSSGPSVCLCPQVSVNGKRLDLTYSFLGSRGVGQCYDSSPCERQPCRHGATCMPAGEYEFQCLCRDGFKGGGAPGLGERGHGVGSAAPAPAHSALPRPTGDLCEHEENPCQLHEPCLHGGTCQGTRCLCPPGFSGPRCQHSKLPDLSPPSPSGLQGLETAH